MTDHAKIPGFPKIHARLTDSHHGTVSVNGLDHPVRASNLIEVRRSIIDHVVGTAHKVGRPVKMDSTDPDGTQWHLVVRPDGTVEEDQSIESVPGKKPTRAKPKNKEKGPVSARAGDGQAEHQQPPDDERGEAHQQDPPTEHQHRELLPLPEVREEERADSTDARTSGSETRQSLPAPESNFQPVLEGGIEYSANQWEHAINEHNKAHGFSGFVRLMHRVITPTSPRADTGGRVSGPAHQK